MRFIYILVASLIIGAVSITGYYLAHARFEQQAIDTSRDRLTLYRASLRSTLERVSHLPRVARLHTDTTKLLRNEISADGLNDYLKEISDAAGSAALYMLDRNANTLAASNFDTKDSFVGNNYSFRPYFKDAMKEGDSTFFAVGVTTSRPGYFISEAVRDGEETIGVAVVKVEFLELLADWQNARENVLISDKDGVVVLASNPEHLYKTLAPISPQRLAEMEETRKFSGFVLKPLEYSSEKNGFSGSITLDGQQFIVTTVDTSGIGWKLHFLTPLGTVQNSALVFSAILFLLCGLASTGVLYHRSRLQQHRLELVAGEADRVREANVRLEQEISERRKTEERLRETQAELIQSSRLAALGKMSAAIVHEVNQPVSAIQMFTASGSLLVKEKRLKEATGVFQEIRKMTERLGAITSDLLVFSRKPVSRRQPVDLNVCVETILAQYGPVLDEHRVTVTKHLSRVPVIATGSQIRFEQLFSNLLKNGMQACAEVEQPRIIITTWQGEGEVGFSVQDNGEGVAPEIMDQLFDPFFTTKEVGHGVGLGLALCYAIADEAGGRIRCENSADGGAFFRVDFPATPAKPVSRPRELADA
jgi:two-component system C4-dicarboxylate transport sensor histidine kinase DctB